jgi:hypothetical protein
MFNYTIKSLAPGSFLVRNLFTLTGTLKDNTILGKRGIWKEWPALCSYSSVGIVQEAGRDCPFPDESAIVLMPSYYRKYLSLNKIHHHTHKKMFFQRLPRDIDGVNATFIPILCLAIHIYRKMDIFPWNPIVFSGCGLLGAILLKLMNIHMIPVTICLDDRDVEKDLLLKNGAEAVFQYGETVPGSLSGISSTAVILSASQYVFKMSRYLLEEKGKIITDAISDHGRNNFWLTPDLVNEAVDLLVHEEINLKDLISHHIHVESIQGMNLETRNRLFNNKILVFDW